MHPYCDLCVVDLTARCDLRVVDLTVTSSAG